jgi:hypothetical protein
MILVPFAVALIAAAAFIVNTQLDKRAGRSFQRIQMGATEMSVVALMGKPDTARPCGENLWWGYSRIPALMLSITPTPASSKRVAM